MNVDPLSSSLYFSAVANASREAQKNQDKNKVEKTRRTSFSSMVDKTKEMAELADAGLPIEIAGLSVEDAVVYLKDAVDSAADRLNDDLSAESFAGFRKAVSHFLKYVQKNNYEVTKIKRFGKRTVKGVFFEETRPRDPYFQVHVIDAKLDELAAMLLQNHADKITMMGKVDEIKGLLVNFLAV